MRQADPDGELVELRNESGEPVDPPVMVARQPEDPGPYYKLYPEGHIANFDGRAIPSPYFLSDNLYDFNRNFPYQWAPEPQQVGAGHYPGSAPETRAVLDFATVHPNIMVWLNLHTFGGVLIRPLGDKPDAKMDHGDLAHLRTGRGLDDRAHRLRQRERLPRIPVRARQAACTATSRTTPTTSAARWPTSSSSGTCSANSASSARSPSSTTIRSSRARTCVRWPSSTASTTAAASSSRGRRCMHPQLGAVEVGGFDPRVGIWNPPYERLAETCQAQSAAFLRVAALVPRVAVEVVRQERAEGHTRIELRIVNRGYLATHGLPSAKALPHSEPLRLRATGEGVTLLAPAESVIEIGHLDGWGSGLHGGPSTFAPWTRGNGHERFVTLLAQGSGTVHVQVGSCRVGQLALDVKVG